jgi:hypothetical protein
MSIHPNPTGDDDGTAYLLGEITSSGKERTEEPLVISGSILTYQQLRQTLTCRQKDTHLALSYHPEDDPTMAERLTDRDLVEKTLFPGWRATDIVGIAVTHGQDWERPSHHRVIRTDVHARWLSLHLGTGKTHNAYYHPSDLKRIDTVKQLINLVRDYAEPAAPKHSRVFGHTAPGTKVHELAQVVEAICQDAAITTREDIARALEAQGYTVKRRKKGLLSRGNSITVIEPDFGEIKLRGSPVSPVKARIVRRSRENRLADIEALITDLNRMCLKRAMRNWEKYRNQTQAQTLEEAEKQNFGFELFTLDELIPKSDYEIRSRRTRTPITRMPREPEGRTTRTRPPSAGTGGTTSEDRESRGREDGPSIGESNRRLDRALERAGELAGKIRKVITERAATRRSARQR